MDHKINILAHNIRFLRKKAGDSQEELSKKLSIKRSNIAAYESKNVEPRLRTVLAIAKLFDVNVRDLLDSKMQEDGKYKPFYERTIDKEEVQVIDKDNSDAIRTFLNKSINIRKVLDGFKAFYTFKKNNIGDQVQGKEKLIFDIDHFIQIMEHLLNHNESVIKALTSENKELINPN